MSHPGRKPACAVSGLASGCSERPGAGVGEVGARRRVPDATSLPAACPAGRCAREHRVELGGSTETRTERLRDGRGWRSGRGLSEALTPSSCCV